MRILREGQPEERVLKPGEKPVKETKTTCPNCLTRFAFTRFDEGVTMTNEREYRLDCPSCGSPLEVQG